MEKAGDQERGVKMLEKRERECGGVFPARRQENQNHAEDNADENLKPELSPRRQPFIVPAPNFLVIVPKTDGAESQCCEQRKPNKNITEVRPEKRRDHNAKQD